MNIEKNSPLSQGYTFPAEWEEHEATWLSYPHNKESWPGKIQKIYPAYHRFISEISKGEKVHISINDSIEVDSLFEKLDKIGAVTSNVQVHHFDTNDAWIRDHGPAFLIKDDSQTAKKSIVKWEYNAWGNKYPHDLDNQIPYKIADYLNLPVFSPKIVMEGGAVDFNGKGILMTTTSCLLNPNRNPQLSKKNIEFYLMNYYGVEQVLWLEEGIEGDDTDGHIDDMTRFVALNKVVTAIEHNRNDTNYGKLKHNFKLLQQMRLIGGKGLEIVEIPMPTPVYYNNTRLPASYANFYICNYAVIVPLFQCKEDEIALQTIQHCFPEKRIVGIDSVDIIWGLGSFHCLSQQEPLVFNKLKEK